MAWERDDTGPDTRAVTPEDVLGAFEAVEGPVVTSGDVAILAEPRPDLLDGLREVVCEE